MATSHTSNINCFILKNYQKEIFTLNSTLYLEQARVSSDRKRKHELLLKSAENLNLTYEDKIYVDDLKEGDLMVAIEEKLD